MTRVTSKQLQPIYDKPMIYYPLATLLEAGVTEILLISTPRDLPSFQQLLGDGSRLGVDIAYAEQNSPRGIAEALVIADMFIDREPFALILGDNIFYGEGVLNSAISSFTSGALIFGYHVSNPSRYGVVELDPTGVPLSIEEKPAVPRSNLAIPGLYIYEPEAVSVARGLEPSARGEYEISDINRHYMRVGKLRVHELGRGVAWLDSGTPDMMLEAANFVATIEHRQGVKIACLEEIAYRNEYISFAALMTLIDDMPESAYRTYLEAVAQPPASSRP